MTLKFLFTTISLFVSIVFAEPSPELSASASTITKKIDSHDGSYSVHIDADKKKVEVKKITEKAGSPPYLRIKILREHDRPLEIRLRTLTTPDHSMRWTGNDQAWNGSMVGAQLEFSFDKRTWKKLGEKIEEILP